MSDKENPEVAGPPKTMDLDYRMWRCGGESPDGLFDEDLCGKGRPPGTMLVDPDARVHGCCCMGLMMMEAGADRRFLEGMPGLAAVAHSTAGLLNGGADRLVRRLCSSAERSDPMVSVAKLLVRANDDLGELPEEGWSRERRIAFRMARIEHVMDAAGLPVRFVNVPGDVGAEMDEARRCAAGQP